jgi:membrane protease YdiL (CAAX protease family)
MPAPPELEHVEPVLESGAVADHGRPTAAQRRTAFLEVILCSDYPTQIALGALFTAFGFGPFDVEGRLRMDYVLALQLTDTVVLLGLIGVFLRAHGEKPRDLLLGSRPSRGEVLYGLPLTLVAIAIGILVLGGLRLVAPWLHTVERNPLQDVIRTGTEAALFAVIAVVAGGVREEIQRAFLLNRFERWLGGPRVGVLVASTAFGAGHLLQGADAAIATGVLGAFWGVIYLRRRSVVAPVVSHSGFNLLQLGQVIVFGIDR